jgi:hypothetical protein
MSMVCLLLGIAMDALIEIRPDLTAGERSVSGVAGGGRVEDVLLGDHGAPHRSSL